MSDMNMLQPPDPRIAKMVYQAEGYGNRAMRRKQSRNIKGFVKQAKKAKPKKSFTSFTMMPGDRTEPRPKVKPWWWKALYWLMTPVRFVIDAVNGNRRYR